ncbi:hypothetical protein R1sor_021018 [Riccia sorocarpa]|uniref:Uncharacterized protein n=1 Tax=Riccia sorocarpa TaxID=122646 RepID=A0ABD3GFU2_9MARC
MQPRELGGRGEARSEESASTSAATSVAGEDLDDDDHDPKAEFVQTFKTILDDMSTYDKWSVNMGGVRVSANEDYYEVFAPSRQDTDDQSTTDESVQVYDTLMITLRKGDLNMSKEEEAFRKKDKPVMAREQSGSGHGKHGRHHHEHSHSGGGAKDIHHPLLHFAKELKSQATEKFKDLPLKKLLHAKCIRYRLDAKSKSTDLTKTNHRGFFSSSVSLLKYISMSSSSQKDLRVATFRLLSSQNPVDIPPSVAPIQTTSHYELSFVPGILPTAALTDGAVAAQKGLLAFLAMLPLEDPEFNPDTWQLLVCNPLLRECKSILQFSTAQPFISWQADMLVNTNARCYNLFVSTVVLTDDNGVGPWTVQVYTSTDGSWKTYNREDVIDPESERPSHAFFLHAGHDLLVFTIEQNDKQLVLYECVDSTSILKRKFEIQLPSMAYAQSGHSAFLVEHNGYAILVALTQVEEDQSQLTTFGIWRLAVEAGKSDVDYHWDEISIMLEDIIDYIDRRGVALEEVEELRYSINGVVIISDIICIEVDFWMSLSDRQEITRLLVEYHMLSNTWNVMRTKERTVEAPGWDLWGKLLRTVYEPRWDIQCNLLMLLVR